MRRVLGKRLHPQRIRRTIGAASCVRVGPRFVLNELRDQPADRGYALRGSGLIAQVRHPLLDMWALEEMFRFHAYRPPERAAASLASLGPRPRVLDLGGHVGYFGLYLRGLVPDARVVSFEPDPSNVQRLRRCIQDNALGDRWEVVEACAATTDGEVPFLSDYHLSSVASGGRHGNEEMHERIGAAFPFLRDTALLSSEQRQVASRDVFPYLAGADFVKMDIEGSEWDILADPRFAEVPARVIVLEYHPVHARVADPEAEVARRLSGAGYEVGAPDRSDDAGLIWAWRPPADERVP